MSSRAFGAAFVLTALGGVVTLTSSGCADDDGAPAASDAGDDGAPRDASRAPPPEDDSAAPKPCREACEEAHPTGLAKDEAVNSCWETFCGAPCVEEQPLDGGVVADGAAPDGGTCRAPVVTISLDCDQCTNTSCCASWDACFEDAECTALNACYQECAD